MKAFIEKEAQEKAKEIKLKADEEYEIEKASIVRSETAAIDSNYEQKVKKASLAQQITKSTIGNKTRLRALATKEEVLNDIFDAAKEKLKAISAKKSEYKPILAKLIEEGLLALLEEKVIVKVREADVKLAKEAAEDAAKGFKEKAKFENVDIEVSETDFLSKALLDIYNTYKSAPEPISNSTTTQPTKPAPKQPDSKLNDSLASLNIGSEPKTRSSRSSSVSSTSSITSNTTRNVPGNRASMVLPLKATPPKPRPSSAIFMNSNLSIPTISTSKPEAEAKTTTPTGRRRSNSQPIRSPVSEERKGLPTVKSPSGSIQSPVGSLRRTLSLTKRSPKPQTDPFVTAPIAEEPEPQLTATQRLQAHLRLAAKTGALMTQEKEILSSVVFDPNDPSSVNLGRKSVNKEANLSASAASAASKLRGMEFDCIR